MEARRYVGIDLGKRGTVTMGNGQTTAAGRQALYRKLKETDAVALEAGNLAFMMAKELEAAVGHRVFVLNTHRLAIIYRSMKKTDKEDALKLAHILEDTREERLPVVPVPSDREPEQRPNAGQYGPHTVGHKIKVEGEDPACGVWFVARADNARVKITEHLGINRSAELFGLIPPLTAGTYTVEVVTRFSGGSSALKEARTIAGEAVLTVQ